MGEKKEPAMAVQVVENTSFRTLPKKVGTMRINLGKAIAPSFDQILRGASLLKEGATRVEFVDAGGRCCQCIDGNTNVDALLKGTHKGV